MNKKQICDTLGRADYLAVQLRPQRIGLRRLDRRRQAALGEQQPRVPGTERRQRILRREEAERQQQAGEQAEGKTHEGMAQGHLWETLKKRAMLGITAIGESG